MCALAAEAAVPPRQSHEAVAFIVPTAGILVQRAPPPHCRRTLRSDMCSDTPAIDVPGTISVVFGRGSFAAAVPGTTAAARSTKTVTMIGKRIPRIVAGAPPERKQEPSAEREQQAGQVAGRLGGREVVPLRGVAAQRAQAVDLAERLDAFGDGLAARTRARAR